MTVIIAIDGPPASGKGTLTRVLAVKLGYEYLDTGMLYRTLAYYVIENNIDITEVEKIVNLANKIDFYANSHLSLSGEDIGQMASKIGAISLVRDVLNEIQKNFPLGKKGVVIDGRDIGTIIFPKAAYKFFITADLKVRAERRFKQLQNEGKNIIFDQVYKDLKERDERDKNRAVAPTTPAADAIIIDTSNLDADAVVELVYSKILN